MVVLYFTFVLYYTFVHRTHLRPFYIIHLYIGHISDRFLGRDNSDRIDGVWVAQTRKKGGKAENATNV